MSAKQCEGAWTVYSMSTIVYGVRYGSREQKNALYDAPKNPSPARPENNNTIVHLLTAANEELYIWSLSFLLFTLSDF